MLTDKRREHWGFIKQTVEVSAREGRKVLADDDTIAVLHPDAEWFMLAPVDLETGDRLLIDRTDGALTEVRRGDALLWRKPPTKPDETRIFNELLGSIMKSVERDEDSITLIAATGETYILRHDQECCEMVWIEDVVGDLTDLVGHPLLMAEEVTNRDDDPPDSAHGEDSYTWTYYKFATIRGYVTIRFFGESNGYYSETAHLYDYGRYEL